MANTPRFLERVEWLKNQKQNGKPISTPFYLIDYYERALSGKPMDWTCQAGNKCFYVSAEGNFQFCYHVPSTPQADGRDARRDARAIAARRAARRTAASTA